MKHKTTEQYKEDYAIKQGFDSWISLQIKCSSEELSDHINVVMRGVYGPCIAIYFTKRQR